MAKKTAKPAKKTAKPAKKAPAKKAAPKKAAPKKAAPKKAAPRKSAKPAKGLMPLTSPSAQAPATGQNFQLLGQLVLSAR